MFMKKDANKFMPTCVTNKICTSYAVMAFLILHLTHIH